MQRQNVVHISQNTVPDPYCRSGNGRPRSRGRAGLRPLAAVEAPTVAAVPLGLFGRDDLPPGCTAGMTYEQLELDHDDDGDEDLQVRDASRPIFCSSPSKGRPSDTVVWPK